MMIVAQEIPSLSPVESYSSSLILERTPRELDFSVFLLFFSGEAHVRWRGYSASSTLLFFGSPTYTPLTSDESLWEAEIPPH